MGTLPAVNPSPPSPAEAAPRAVLAVSSNKGGVGKTTLATNLAIYLRALREALPVAIVGLDDQSGVDRMFDPVVYKRGALTLHALRTKVGDATFFALLRSWVAEHRHGTVTTDEFRGHVRRFAAVDGLLDAWLDRPELPPLPVFGL